MNENTKNGAGTMIVAFAAGAAAGAIAALLLAPRSGTETRALVAKTAKSATDLATRVPVAIRDASGAARSALNAALDG